MAELTMLYPSIITTPSASTIPVNISGTAIATATTHKLHDHHQRDDDLLDDDDDVGSLSSDGGRSSATSRQKLIFMGYLQLIT